MLVEIGTEKILEELPKSLILYNNPFILTNKKNGSLVLYSAICPHMQGTVIPSKNEIWTCPSHGWTFNADNGKSINSPQSSLGEFEVVSKNGKLFVEIPELKKNGLSLNKVKNEEKDKRANKKGPKITLVKHASLLIEWDGFNLLTDPWIEGPALFGSWTHYPPSDYTVSNLPKIDAIWISHEHSDHLHENSLSKFEKDIPIFVSKFGNDRLAKRVKKLGFTDVNSMSSFEPFKITKSIEATSFKSSSVWNDNILLLEMDDFKILNFNDAGINMNIQEKIPSVDLICSVFAASGSAYPTNWSHLDEISKNRIMTDSNKGLLHELKRMVDMFNPQYIIPFASYMALYHPDHLKYQVMKPNNSINDVVNYFKNSKVEILDLLPGESWDGNNKNIQRVSNRERYFDKEYFYKYLKEKFEKEKNKKFVPEKFTISHNEIKKYFEGFKNTELSKYVRKMKLSFIAYSKDRKLCSLITFNDGEIIYQETKNPVKGDLEISCPGAIVQNIIENDLSWDESFYWCDFHRDPDVYNLAFWRILHAPWRARFNNEYTKIDQTNPLGKMSIATMIEKGGNKMNNILEKYGLYCSGCLPSIGENLEDGCAIHGISREDKENLLNEVKQYLKTLKI